MKPKFDLDHYKYPFKIKKQLEAVVSLIVKEKYLEAEKAFAKKTIEVLEGIKKGEIDPAVADEIFTLLDIYISDNFPEPPFSEDFFNLLMEGMHLHHFGDNTSWEPDLEEMKRMAGKLLRKL